jgi:hypothetical protein
VRRPVTDTHIYAQCLAGIEPAELLSPVARRALLRDLHAKGWTDVEIAAHTMWTTSVVARIRAELNLPANQPVAGRAVA